MLLSNGQCQISFLWCIGCIYMFAFASLYFQIPGLYGPNGILPAELQLRESCSDTHQKCENWASDGECVNNPSWMMKNCPLSCKTCEPGSLPLLTKFQNKLTLLWFSPYIGLDIETGMEFIAILGTLLSICVLITHHFRNRIVFAMLWLLYFSLYQVGQTFLWFQWDILLLETGFLSIFVAPLFLSKECMNRPYRHLPFWLVKWLLFRLMLASGIVKLTSMCPTWWGLTALNWHYESQCIPTPLAWYAHQLPDWFQKLSVVATYLIEIVMPFLFFCPIKSIKLLSFWSQVLLQVLIILTGNYNFFNLLTMSLCFSLVDDGFLQMFSSTLLSKGKSVQRNTRKVLSLRRIFDIVLFLTVFFVLGFFTQKYFMLKIVDTWVVQSDIAFSKSDFISAVKLMTKTSILLALVALGFEVLHAFYKTLRCNVGVLQKIVLFAQTSFFTGVTIWLFCISLVPFTEIDHESQQDLPVVIHDLYSHADRYQIANSYGLFRRMTGVGGRPELVIEGTNNLGGEWKEYNFLYKPGNLSQSLPIVAPHQPRLDWQMWFAALGSYQHNPWFVHLIYKLLIGEKAVLKLLGENPFPGKPPTYIRSVLYTYHYTRIPKDVSGIVEGVSRSSHIKKWWKRDSPKEYTPPLTKDEPSLIRYLNDMGWKKKSKKKNLDTQMYQTILLIRQNTSSLDPRFVIFQLLLFSICTNMLKKFFIG